MRPPEGFEWLLILFIVLLLFGAKRLPDMARSLGRSARILKAEARGLADDGSGPAAAAELPAQSAAPQQAAPAGQPVQQPAEKPGTSAT